MNAVDLLREHYKSVHDILDGTIEGCPEDALHWRGEGAKIDTIAHIYLHTLTSVDAVLHGMLQGKPSLYKTDDWSAKTGVTLPEGHTEDELFPALGDIDIAKIKPYGVAVREAVDAFLAGLDDAALDKVIDTGFMGEAPLGNIFSTFILWHVANHTGEIAALKGVQGHQGLPF